MRARKRPRAAFKKGRTGPERARRARAGRVTVKEAIQHAAEAIGNKRGADDDESGSRALARYFERLAEEYPSECARLLDLVLQLQEENVDRDTEKGVYRTAEEFRAALARDGVPGDYMLTPAQWEELFKQLSAKNSQPPDLADFE